MAWNQTNRFQSLDSSVEEFVDGQENENNKKKTKHDAALFHEFLVLRDERDKWTNWLLESWTSFSASSL